MRIAVISFWLAVSVMLTSLLAPLVAEQLGTEVTLVAPASSEEVAINQELWVPGEPVTAVYGHAMGHSVKILFADDSRLLRPKEDPSLLLYTVDKQAGENPLQVKTVRFVAKFVLLGSTAVALLSLLARWWMSRSRRRTQQLLTAA